MTTDSDLTEGHIDSRHLLKTGRCPHKFMFRAMVRGWSRVVSLINSVRMKSVVPHLVPAGAARCPMILNICIRTCLLLHIFQVYYELKRVPHYHSYRSDTRDNSFSLNQEANPFLVRGRQNKVTNQPPLRSRDETLATQPHCLTTHVNRHPCWGVLDIFCTFWFPAGALTFILLSVSLW